MNPRAWLIGLAGKLESTWQKVDWNADRIEIQAGWYISVFMLPGSIQPTPRLVLENEKGSLVERKLIGFHSGRNRMLFYLPSGRLTAFSKSIEFKELARVTGIEGRARVALICARYLFDFFSFKVLLRMLLMQFQHAFELSSELLHFYAPRDHDGYLQKVNSWNRFRGFGKIFARYYAKPKIAVLIEAETQRDALSELLVEADCVLRSDQLAELPTDIDYILPLNTTEHLRFASILMIKKAIAEATRGGSKPSLVYTDHDYQYDERAGDKVMAPVFKPDPSLAYLYCFNYLGPAVLFAVPEVIGDPTFLLTDEGRYREALRLMQDSSRVLHLDEALINSDRQELLLTPPPHSSYSNWVDLQWQRQGEHNALIASESAAEEASVDLIIPTRDGLEFLRPCVESILNKTDHLNFHIYIVDNGSKLAETKNYLQTLENNSQVTVLDYPGEFNYSAINNFAASHGSADFIGLINNDIEVIDPNWLREMLAWSIQENVGVVGAKLLFGNGKVQHAGVTIGMGNAAGHLHRLEEGDAPGYQNRCIATQNMMAVTAACLITPRSLFEKLDGLDERHFAVAYNDIDYCLRVEALGLDIIWTPQARLFHHESVTRGDDLSAPHIQRYFRELGVFQKRWKTKGFVDKYYSRHLRISDEGVYPQISQSEEDVLHIVGIIK